MSIVSRPDRKEMVKREVAKGRPLQEIAEISGWSLVTIKRDSAALSKVSNDTKRVSNDTDEESSEDESLPSATGSAETLQHRAQVAEIAAAQGETEEPTERYRIIYADPPWSYGTLSLTITLSSAIIIR
jgi:16S rRNA G966 N2-methylase RsmD